MVMLMIPLCLSLCHLKVAVAESINRDFNRVNEWCDLCGMKLNASMIKTMMVYQDHAQCISSRLACTW